MPIVALPIQSDFSSFYKTMEGKDKNSELTDETKIVALFQKNLSVIQNLIQYGDSPDFSHVRDNAQLVYKGDGNIELKLNAKNKSGEKIRKAGFNAGLFANASRDTANLEKFSEYVFSHFQKHPPLNTEDAKLMLKFLEPTIDAVAIYQADLRQMPEKLKDQTSKDAIRAMETVKLKFSETHKLLTEQIKKLDKIPLEKRAQDQIAWFQKHADDPRSVTELAMWIKGNGAAILSKEPFKSKTDLAKHLHVEGVKNAVNKSEDIKDLLIAEMLIRNLDESKIKEIIKELDEAGSDQSSLTPSQMETSEREILEREFPVSYSFVTIEEFRDKAKGIAERKEFRAEREKKAEIFKGAGKMTAGTALIVGGITLAIITGGGQAKNSASAVAGGLKLGFSGALGLKKALEGQGIDEASVDCFNKLVEAAKKDPNKVKAQILDFYKGSEEAGEVLIQAVAAAQKFIS